jgi:hypothetical protein
VGGDRADLIGYEGCGAKGSASPARNLGTVVAGLATITPSCTARSSTRRNTSNACLMIPLAGAPQPRDIRDLINYYDADRSTADRIRRWAADGRRHAWWKEYSDVVSA